MKNFYLYTKSFVVDIEPSYIYGIRSYQKGSRLEEHVDRLETHHISSIIIVDKDLTCGCASKNMLMIGHSIYKVTMGNGIKFMLNQAT